MEAYSQQVMHAYHEYDREMTIRKTRLGCLIGVVFVPLFSVLDFKVFDFDKGVSFLWARLACAFAMLAWYPILNTRFGKQHYRAQGLLLLFLPTLLFAWMIFETGGAASEYYAGMNLVLMVLALVLDWTFTQSLTAVFIVISLYLGTVLIAPQRDGHDFFRDLTNNLFFLTATGVVIAVGTYFHSRLRLREFASKFELDQSRRQLEENNQRLRELDEAKSRFFANISHELRTPLTLLIAPLENLMRRFGDRFDVDTREAMTTMHANAMRLLKLINDLLDLVRLESGRTVVKNGPLDVAEFLQSLAVAAREVARQKNLSLKASVDPAVRWVTADRDKLEKVLLNLQFNAIKFTPEGGRIELRAHRDGDQLVFEVSDTGVGIPAEKLPQVFNRFFQADDSSQRKFQGVGIGLALVKELSEVMGGSAAVHSALGQGSTFTVRLPYQEAPPAAPKFSPGSGESADETSGTDGNASNEWLVNLYRRAELVPAAAQQASELPEPVSFDGSRPLVLVADDEPDMRRFLVRQISRRYQVAEASDGEQAIEQALLLRPSLILLDMMMPVKDGLQVCRELRGSPELQNTPIIMLTARADEETKLNALSSGANDYLTKPFMVAELEARVRNLIAAAEYQQELATKNTELSSTLKQLQEAESELVQSEKLASLGRLSAGIIHEINNPLNYANTGLYALRGKARQLEPESRAEFLGILHDVGEGLQRVTAIVSDLRAFAHRENSAIDLVDVAEVVQSALRFLSHEMKDRARLVTRLPVGLAVPANRNKLIQVLVNLVQNSIDALAEKSIADEEPTIWIEGRSEEGRVYLSVRDNGEGIEPENIDKIFDPFFTTKGVGEGMGLGLSICFRIVQEFGGRIQVRSERGRFCEFSLEFPEPASAPVAAARTA